ncbi:polyribonucleotide nucleotidyltransferase [Patescibacteria group bacterium]|nr:polyribonucleotide nucleotidyltransferase [Patescibacteria group bacterium]MBU4274338.1 polyribonucleotide nucleotidyltransferase [Patescibacteria group bacterium]MBU4367554.1 polyribonucleotide nucleotidyltransferase [Patescibacteria group bacterium]MBU4461595.1 polyribonucleotide nucleotidyltransferase [Patescibacteria group bacterium]MCG2699492.1 polyribonucleotide nucleotidyltransferase [Candidatus Parcubacteria bacterium]
MEKDIKKQIEINGRILQIKITNWAEQASGSCLVQMGETEVLATAVMSAAESETVDFFPLTVDYEERHYAAGKIFGSRFIRREGRPTDEAILTGRMIDRAIRPRFPKEFKRETQIIVTCLSWDGENDSDVLGMIAASTALSISDIPFQGPVSVIRVGRIDGSTPLTINPERSRRVDKKWVFNPTYEEREKSDIDLVLTAIEANKKILINMIEMGAKEISEEDVIEATKAAEPELKKLIDFQKKITEEIGKEKITLPTVVDHQLEKEVKEFAKNKLENGLKTIAPKEKDIGTIADLKEELVNLIKEKYSDPTKIKTGLEYFEKELKKAIYKNIIEDNKRPDGRKRDELRKISCEVGVLPRTHGSGLFSRGLTRVLSILTLGGPKDQQLLEGMEFIGKKRFMHHYNFPPYSSGEVSFLRGPKRREIGHGCLVEKALLPLIPDFEQFPYTIRVVSEVLSSNGSTSMASVCATTLALMDAGVPIKEVAAGISIGLAENEDPEKQKLIVDIQGPEDHLGGMDFKVAGTKNGITAIQMDTKTDGITKEIMKEALSLAKEARSKILDIINKTISKPRETLSPWAPKIKTVQINPSKIGEVVGPRGSVINKLIEQYKVSIDIEDSGLVYITGQDDEAVEKTIQQIKNMTREVQVGEIFQGEVKRILDFGAFVETLPGVDGLVHISNFVPYRIKSVNEIVKIGDIIPVKVISVDEMGRINLSAIEAGFKPKTKK